MRSVVFVHNARLPKAAPLAEKLAKIAKKVGARTRCCNTIDEAGIHTLVQDADLVVTLGGDGTILRASRLAIGSGASLVGVNLGELGFLAELTPENAPEKLVDLLNGAGWIEERLALAVIVHGPDGSVVEGPHVSLNDVLVGRGEISRVVRIRVKLDDLPFTSVIGDGVLVATPTGSTAYNLSAGGSIVDPRLPSILLTPLLPYLTFSYPMVLASSTRIGLEISTEFTATLSVDGQIDLALHNGQSVQISADPRPCRFLRLNPPDTFFRTLAHRLRPDHFWDGGEG